MNKLKSFQEIQGILSIGYVLLIGLGILNETLFYNQVGINILKYSSILDVLISPLAKLTSSGISIAIFVVLIIIIINIPSYLAKKRDKKWFQRIFKFEESNPPLSLEETRISILKTISFLFSLGLMGFYVGTGLGGGFKMSKKIKSGKIEYKDKLNFVLGESLDVKIIGSNSSYIFYLTPNDSIVSVTPISGEIRSIQEFK